MPAARYGEDLIQADIAVWLGASHWSKPSPRKLPGVTGFAAYAGADGPVSSPAARTPASPVTRAPRRVEKRIAISKNVGISA